MSRAAVPPLDVKAPSETGGRNGASLTKFRTQRLDRAAATKGEPETGRQKAPTGSGCLETRGSGDPGPLFCGAQARLALRPDLAKESIAIFVSLPC
jgi:hypothetical protein